MTAFYADYSGYVQQKEQYSFHRSTPAPSTITPALMYLFCIIIKSSKLWYSNKVDKK